MAFLRLLNACFTVAVALQIGQEKIKALPEVSEVLSKPTNVFEALTSKISSLNARLAEAQQEGTVAIKIQKAKYEAILEAQRQNNTALARKNNDTRARIAALKWSNAELHSKARTLTEQSASLTTELRALQSNISTADEFVASALNASTGMLLGAPQLQVLKELAQKDAEVGQNRERESRLNEIGMSFLQTGASTSGLDAQNILESLNSALDDLAKEQNASALSMKSAFEKEYQAGEDQHNKLLANQAELNATETSALELNARLTVAVKHLEQTRETMLEKRQSVQLYMQRVGAVTFPEQNQGTALLQVDQGLKKKHALPDVSDVLTKQKGAFETVNSKVSSLESRLADVQQEGTAAIKAQEAQYEATLDAQRLNNTALERRNNDTSVRINALKILNEELRSRARTLTEQSASLTADLNSLRANISTADEFVANALETSTEMLLSAPELQVLKELAQKDAEVGQNRERESRLNEIRASMLQTSTSGIDVQNMLESLNSALDDLAKERNASASSLKHAFDREYQAGEDQHNKLLANQAELNATETAALELNERLTAAVKHLEQSRDTLLEKSKSLRLYIQHVGAFAFPEQKQNGGAVELHEQNQKQKLNTQGFTQGKLPQ